MQGACRGRSPPRNLRGTVEERLPGQGTRGRGRDGLPSEEETAAGAVDGGAGGHTALGGAGRRWHGAHGVHRGRATVTRIQGTQQPKRVWSCRLWAGTSRVLNGEGQDALVPVPGQGTPGRVTLRTIRTRGSELAVGDTSGATRDVSLSVARRERRRVTYFQVPGGRPSDQRVPGWAEGPRMQGGLFRCETCQSRPRPRRTGAPWGWGCPSDGRAPWMRP